jgi:hypothetical protein
MRIIIWFTMIVLAVSIAGYAVVQYVLIGAEEAGLVQSKLLLTNLNSIWGTANQMTQNPR